MKITKDNIRYASVYRIKSASIVAGGMDPGVTTGNDLVLAQTMEEAMQLHRDLQSEAILSYELRSVEYLGNAIYIPDFLSKKEGSVLRET